VIQPLLPEVINEIKMNPKQFQNIWLADDDLDDREIFSDALSQILPGVNIRFIANGDQVLECLNESQPPELLFLDINMPCKDGLDCLREIRSDSRFERLPIIMFSSSVQPKHIDSSYNFGANLYYTKPSSYSSLMQGLNNLFQMNWNDPFSITSHHFINNRHIPFSGVGLSMDPE
jgi:CheY-like chemotaxis protein